MKHLLSLLANCLFALASLGTRLCAVPVSGLVVDDEGRPVAKATVVIDAKRAAHGDRAAQVLSGHRVVTDEDGIWRLPDIFPDADAVKIGVYHYDYDSCHNESYNDEGQCRGTFPMEKCFLLSEFYAGKTRRVLKRGVRVSGVVRDSLGMPMPGANVMFGSEDSSVPTALPTQTTDAAGRFSLATAPYSVAWITVSAPGFSPELKKIRIQDSPVENDFSLMPSRPLVAWIVDGGGFPLKGARARVESWRGGNTLGGVELTSDEKGRIELRDAPQDEVSFVITHMDFAGKHGVKFKVGGKNRVALGPRTKVSGLVLDGMTEEPLANFVVERGQFAHSTSRFADWDVNTPGQADFAKISQGDTLGRFHVALSMPQDRSVFRVSAEGYYPALSRPVRMDGEKHELVFRLTRGSPLHLRIADAFGRPLSGALLAPVRRGMSFVVENGRIAKSDGIPIFTTSADGMTALSPQIDRDYRLIILHEAGTALVEASDLRAGAMIRLNAWGRIAGSAFTGKTPRVGERVFYENELANGQGTAKNGKAGDDGWRIRYETFAVVDAAGNFEMAYVLPGNGQLSLNGAPALREPVHVESGQKLSISLGGRGRPVTGRFVIREALKQRGIRILRAILSPHKERTHRPVHDVWEEDTPSMGGQIQRRLQKLKGEKAALTHPTDEEKHQEYLSTNLYADGSFRFEDIRPGRYTLWAYAGKEAFVPPTTFEVTLPEKKDYEAAPIELGPVDVEFRRLVSAGEFAPDFTFNDLDGREHRLNEYKGRYVLLHFWQAKSRRWRTELPIIRELQQRCQNDPRIIIINISMDTDSSLLGRYIYLSRLDGFYGYLNELQQRFIHNVNVSNALPSAWLIGPSGHVLARDLYGEEIKETVLRHLGRR
ncbi:MAG: carboxypeptidase regulatory-like domain-containing protein [Puniceicoccales bacterium]|nr:carboxypeptidase regulatory-like domain-containing protein [Puniceicoccales bacterium]